MTRHEHFARYWSPAREAAAPQSEAEYREARLAEAKSPRQAEIREQNARRAADR